MDIKALLPDVFKALTVFFNPFVLFWLYISAPLGIGVQFSLKAMIFFFFLHLTLCLVGLALGFLKRVSGIKNYDWLIFSILLFLDLAVLAIVVQFPDFPQEY